MYKLTQNNTSQSNQLFDGEDHEVYLEPVIIIRNVPRSIDRNGIRNLCSKYGTVEQIFVNENNIHRCPNVFVRFHNVCECEAAIKGISSDPSNEYLVTFKRPNSKKAERTPSESHLRLNTGHVNSDRKGNNGSFKGPFSRPKKPDIPLPTPLLTELDYKDSQMSAIDPNKEFLAKSDLYEFDRNSDNSKKVVQGRKVYREPEHVTKKINEKSAKSLGAYNSNQNNYVTKSNGDIPSAIEIGSCNFCANQATYRCERCYDFYCSVDCQRKDWKTHRLNCIRMPALIPSVAIKNQTAELSMDLTSISSMESKTKNKLSNGESSSSNNKQQQQQKQPSNDKANSENLSVKDRAKISPKLSNNQEPLRQPNSPCPNKSSVLSTPIQTKTLTPSVLSQKKKLIPSVSKNYIPYNALRGITLNSVGFPKPGSTVVLTTIVNARAVYIRPNDGDSSRKYSAIINDVEAFSKTANYLTKYPEQGDIALADFEGNWFRVVVLKLVDENKVSVAYLDFGNLELRKYTELKECTEKLASQMRYAVRANLDGIEETEKNAKVMDYLNELVSSVTDLTIDYPLSYSQNDIQVNGIKLIVTSKKQIINDQVRKLLTVEKPEMEDMFSCEDLPDYSIPVNENVEFVLLDNSYLAINILSCAYVPDYLRLCEMNKPLQAYGDQTTEIYTPPVEKLCLAKYVEDNEWYRALCLECVGDGSPTLQFIDYGNVDKVNIQNIRKIPKDFLYACPTKICKIKDLPDKLPESMVEEITSLISANTTFKAVKIEESLDDKDIFWLYIPELISKLKGENLI